MPEISALTQLTTSLNNMEQTVQNQGTLIQSLLVRESNSISQPAVVSDISNGVHHDTGSCYTAKVSSGMFPHVQAVAPNVRKQILEGKYINLATLLNNKENVQDYKTVDESDGSVLFIKHRDPRLQRNLSIQEFLEAFNIYKNIICEKQDRRIEFDMYIQDIIDISARYKGPKFPDDVTKLVDDELRKGYLIGPFTKPPFDTYRISPIGIVEGKYSKKKRLILDLSAPHNNDEHHSINDLINKEDYSLTYVRIDDAISIIKSLGIKSQLSFGCRSSPKIFDTLSEAICWILQNNYGLRHVLHLLDDFLLINNPYVDATRKRQPSSATSISCLTPSCCNTKLLQQLQTNMHQNSSLNSHQLSSLASQICLITSSPASTTNPFEMTDIPTIQSASSPSVCQQIFNYPEPITLTCTSSIPFDTPQRPLHRRPIPDRKMCDISQRLSTLEKNQTDIQKK
ncbi:unnamed protein product [Mytilus coruscus]|uniref:Reverse transcriptase domain-containing protein n=1 Tax=Mytilus coruscus TaxID=42192 RepID=A0A6J8AIE4_MYTCO|nr:unnamed protein product [Mytilus coruscus]